MKKSLGTAIFMLFAVHVVFSQDITTDTTQAGKLHEAAYKGLKNREFQYLDSFIVNFTKATEVYKQYKVWDKYLESHYGRSECYARKRDLNKVSEITEEIIKVSKQHFGSPNKYIGVAWQNMGLAYFFIGSLDSTLVNFHKAFDAYKAFYTKNNLQIARICQNLGLAYWYNSEYEKALEYSLSGAEIIESLFGENSKQIAGVYVNIGGIYFSKTNYDKALEYLFRSLEIEKGYKGENHYDIALSYNNIGTIFQHKTEYDKALQYFFQSERIYKNVSGDKAPDLTLNYNNIGYTYQQMKIYDKALEYFNKGLEINEKLHGKIHQYTSKVYNNIATVYWGQERYDMAEKYLFDALDIENQLFNHTTELKGSIYHNLASIYVITKEYSKATEFLEKDIKAKTKLFGTKHKKTSNVYALIGKAYMDQKKYTKALFNYQKSLCANMQDYNDTINIYTNPLINNYFGYEQMIETLGYKAELFELLADSNETFENLDKDSLLNLALQNNLLCDEVLDKARRQVTLKSDKIRLGELGYKIYSQSIRVAKKLNRNKTAFSLAEKNKSAVLQSSLAQANALQFLGLPDSLVEREKSLQTKIALLKQELAEQPDSAQKVLFHSKLFDVNRSYEELNTNLETNFPNYYSLKHSTKTISVKEIQEELDKNTALISYFISDSAIYAFTITQKDYNVFDIKKAEKFNRVVKNFRQGIVSRIDRFYYKFAHKLYKQLFPENAISENIENLIIIPDGILSTIPFEALLTNENDNESYLIKKYNISYAYSANLWYQNQKSSAKVEKFHEISLQKRQPQNDLLAIAPVFEDKNMSGVSLRTRSLLINLDSLSGDSINTRGRLLNGSYVSPLPGTEEEVKQLYNIFASNNRKAYIKTHGQAREEFLKSDTISQYKYIHIATHGFVNSEKPELSGILLAQDTTSRKFETFGKFSEEDGILYSGEIYNLNLNAELVTLSACETGLGQIKKGEGVIGLTRALMYAGAKNIVVSLWKVADESTSQLMVDFYKNIIKQSSRKRKKTVSYADALREAKLKMISEEKFAHPFYWSPFVVIGE